MDDIELFIFDVDGVFRDSTEAVGEGFRKAFGKNGLRYDFRDSDVYRLLGLGKYNDRRMCTRALLAFTRSGDDLGRIIVQQDAEPAIDRILGENTSPSDDATVETLQSEYYLFLNSSDARKLVKPYQDSETNIDRLLKSGYKVATFSNSSIASVRRDIWFLDKFNAVATIEDVKSKKPSGEGIRLVCARLGIAPERSAYVGDTVVDVRAAKDARCMSIALLSGMGLEIHLRMEGPDMVLPALSDVVKAFSGPMG